MLIAITIAFILSFVKKAILQESLDKLWVLQIAIYSLVCLGDHTPATVEFYLNLLLEAANVNYWIAHTR